MRHEYSDTKQCDYENGAFQRKISPPHRKGFERDRHNDRWRFDRMFDKYIREASPRIVRTKEKFDSSKFEGDGVTFG